MNKDRLQQIIAEYMPHRWAELIEPMAEAILDNLHDDKPKQKPEWEEKLDELTAGEWDKFRLEEIFKDFMKREFKAMGDEIIQPDNGIIELSAYPSEAYKQGIDDMKYKVNEALRKRGVK